MTAEGRVQLCRIVASGAILWATTPGLAIAGFADEPFQLRVLLSLDRSSNFSDTAGRQASVAFPGGSSDNPAATDWQPRPILHPGVSLTNIHAVSESDTWVTAAAGTVNLKLPDAGTLSLAYARTYTLDHDTRQGLSDDLRSNEFFVTHGKRISKKIALGGTLRLTDSMIKEQFFEPRLGGLSLESKVESRMVDASLGLLAEPLPGWFVGAAVSVGWGEADTVVRNRTPLPVPPFGILLPPGTAVERLSDDVGSFGVRAGAGYAPNRTYGAYIDAQYLMADSNLAGSAEIARVTGGVDVRISESVILRTGLGVDTEQEVTVSIGASYRNSGPLAVDVAYQHNAQPEVQREFGDFDLFSASLSYRF